ncbi:MAG: squalene--hopene cyclase [Planctomycetales bacterium]|nr:squalene--hopene cyclase [Planctomycetales bacterium]
MTDSFRLTHAYHQARRDLLDRLDPKGFWTGKLASSALSTATAISALAIYQRHSPYDDAKIDRLICSGIRWLAKRQNADGGWGDTDQSNSNISTTMLVLAAFQLTAVPDNKNWMIERAEEYVRNQGGIKGLKKRYGRDKTFAVPILANCALAERVSWKKVAALPFELACFPQSFYRFLRLPVVSYAIPALVAIGQAKFYHHKPWNPITRLIRKFSAQRSLRVLEKIQPASGGYLEAIPLTSFVAMSLAAIGHERHPVVRNAVRFLMDTVREDGSWPIDTNLATWNTTLSINAISADGDPLPGDLDNCLSWLLSCQNTDIHPFTGAAPGGWGWSDLSGAVPDADDTPGALLALRKFYDSHSVDSAQRARIKSAAANGLRWLLDLQNRDGGWPTFCRGWGKLPFDRSGTDLTAHAIRALHAWRELVPQQELLNAVDAGFKYLAKQQRADGVWIPLWFGNQSNANEENPVYGTSKVLLAYRDLGKLDQAAARRAVDWLVKNRNLDQGWGGDVHKPENGLPSSVEETALAVEALLPYVELEPKVALVVKDGLQWLTAAVDENRHLSPSPIGFYFAKLWYYEELYPLVFTVSALAAAQEKLADQTSQMMTKTPVNAS